MKRALLWTMLLIVAFAGCACGPRAASGLPADEVIAASPSVIQDLRDVLDDMNQTVDGLDVISEADLAIPDE